MKEFSLCSGRKCCPAIVLEDNGRVIIGEGDNSVSLTKSQWEILKELIKTNKV